MTNRQIIDRQRAYKRGKNIRRKKKIRKKSLFVFDVIILLLLSLIVFAAVWVSNKSSLINYVVLDKDRLFTADYVNGGSFAPGNMDRDQKKHASSMDNIDMITLVGVDSRDNFDAYNTDTMIIAGFNRDDKTIKLASLYRDTYLNIGNSYSGKPNHYTKANAAYNTGGPEQMLSMINLNFDLNITKFIIIQFKALADTVELLGGLDIDMTREEAIHLNNYNVETSLICGKKYTKLELPPADEFDGAITKTFHLNGTQAVSYVRIRNTIGNDFRRTSRQRLVLEKILKKAKNMDFWTMNTILNTVLRQIGTNIDRNKVISMIYSLRSYTIIDQTGFPFTHTEDNGNRKGEDFVFPVTLEYNAIRLHKFFFPNLPYKPSNTVLKYSNHIIGKCGYGKKSIKSVSKIDDGAKIPR